tara:strand:+ start:15681 stop:16469 length:789 start_codon:yes stop_codon:yes gene_type:complete
MKMSLLIAATLLSPAFSMAQEASEQRSPASIVRAELTAELQKQTTAYRAASAKLRASDAYEQAKSNRKALTDLMKTVVRPDATGLARKAIAAADKCTGDDRASLLCWAAINARNVKLIRDVVARIERDHIKSPALVELMEEAMAVSRLFGRDRTAALLQKVVANATHPETRAWAMYWQAKSLDRKRASDADKAMAAKLRAEAEKLAAGTALADMLVAPRFKDEHLQIGMVAPDIVGEDIDGVKFKLSDYRGKVVVIDFWGFW